MTSCDIAIVGAGVMGAACACELARAGLSVYLIDQTEIPNPRAASIDHSKVFRFAYDDSVYVRMAIEALGLWHELENETKSKLLDKTGMLLIGHRRPSFESQTYETMIEVGVQVEMLSSADVCRRFPQFDPEAVPFAVFDPAGAILYAERAVDAMIALARRRGVRVLEYQRVARIKNIETGCMLMTESGQKVFSQSTVIASGPWTRKLLPEIASSLKTTRQEVLYFEPVYAEGEPRSGRLSFAASDFPIFAALDRGFYGLPVHHQGALKIANHHKGQPVDPDSVEDRVGDDAVAECRAFFSRYIPGLSRARLVETRVCVYNNTPDDDFIIDWHPEIRNALIITGFSGHGFKFGPIIGKIAAELILSEHSTFETSRFSLKRFRPA